MHVSESFKLMQRTGCNVLEKLRPEEYRQARRRIIECVLSTDMVNHANFLASLKTKLETMNINKGNNLENLFVANNLTKTYENQQIVLGMCIHASDISNPAKLPDVYRMWVDFVFLEFYNQGDLEKQMGLPVSLLCDRTNTNINISQLGFINFIVEPTFDAVIQIIPEIYPYMHNIKKNLKMFELLVKEEKDRKENEDNEKQLEEKVDIDYV